MTVPAGGSLQRNVTKGVLRDGKGKDFTFEYNPTEISLSHNAEGLTDPVGQDSKHDHSLVAAMVTRGSTRLIMSTLVLTGTDIRSRVELLLEWVVERTQQRPEGTTVPGERERLTFQWGTTGTGLDYTVELMRFDCTYTRFTRDGLPIRAEIHNLTLHVLGKADATPATAGTGGTAPAAVTPGVPAGFSPASTPGPRQDPTRDMANRLAGR
ncbi:hypothetical protein ACFY3O_28380 [Streptomyces sp. NPDC001046]|uniref:CIS tube protein n=1 Tax=Streptomyces sp. NPDC001046 TaxID=3364543 RepID=UPI0036BF3AAF